MLQNSEAACFYLGLIAVQKMRGGKSINLLDLQHWFVHSSILTTQPYAVEVDRKKR